jgi:hypothetical protein
MFFDESPLSKSSTMNAMLDISNMDEKIISRVSTFFVQMMSNTPAEVVLLNIK